MTDNDRLLTKGLLPGVLTGLGAMVLGAAAYGALLGFSGYGFGYVGAGVGVLVGLAMTAAEPTSPVLPPLAALFSLAGAALGQLAGSTVSWAQRSGSDYGAALRDTYTAFPQQLGDRPVWILFWVIAACAGFGFVRKHVTSARRALAAPSLPQRDEAGHADDVTPRKRA